jgi:hypothetical protein
MPELDVYREAIVRYRKWLDQLSCSACGRFLTRIGSTNDATVEGALGEALAWNWLGPRSSEIHVNEHESEGGVDFVCTNADRRYYVEVSTLTIATVTSETGLQHLPSGGAQNYGDLTRAVMRKVISKAAQASGLDKPYLLFVPTVHFQASAITLSTHHLQHILVGHTGIGGKFDPEEGAIAGGFHHMAMLDSPAFFKPKTLEPVRRHMSAVLVGGFGIRPPECRVRGVIHPDPLRPFDRACLPDTCFGRLDPWPPANGLHVVWERADGTPCDEKTERERRQREAEMRLRKAGFGPHLDEFAHEARKREQASSE